MTRGKGSEHKFSSIRNGPEAILREAGPGHTTSQMPKKYSPLRRNSAEGSLPGPARQWKGLCGQHNLLQLQKRAGLLLPSENGLALTPLLTDLSGSFQVLSGLG